MDRFSSTAASRTLKVVGVILILSFLVDCLILMLPFQPTARPWQIGLATALVDRGIVPLVALGMLFAAHGIDDDGQSLDLRFPALVISSILGLIFLLIFPLHLNNVNQAKGEAVQRITREAEQAESQVKGQLSQLQAQLGTEQAKAELEKQRQQFKTQIADLLKDEQKFNQTLQNSQIGTSQKDLLKKFKQDPKALEDYIAQQTNPTKLADQRLVQIRTQKEELEKQAQNDALKSGLRIGISSLLLSIGYIIIGWTGLRGLGALQGGGSNRKAPAR
jgi:hypothetical protein